MLDEDWEEKDKSKLLPEEYSLILVPIAEQGAKPLANNQGMIWLDLSISKELENEGIARDIIRLVQQARKDAQFDVSDRIELELKSNLDLIQVLDEHSDLICSQTLSTITAIEQPDYSTEAPLFEHMLQIAIKK